MKTVLKSVVMFAVVLALLAACAQPAPTPTPTPIPQPTATPTPEPVSVTLEYIGHSAFLLKAADGTRIMMDPYHSYVAPAEIAQFPSGLKANIVTVSHFHSDHSNVAGAVGARAIYQPDLTDQAGVIKITTYKSDHGLAQGTTGASLGDNTVFVFETGGIKIVHLGAAGYITQPDVLAAIANADVVTFDADGAAFHPIPEMLAQLKAQHVRTIVPTHYSLSKAAPFFGAITLDEFLAKLPPDLKSVEETGSDLTVTPGMPEQVVALTPLALSLQKQ